MRLKKFKAFNFRNISSCEIEFSEGVNLLYGNNAQGKTNAVEGIYIFARGKSHRASEDKELIKFGEEGFNLSIEYEDGNGINTLEYSLYGKERRRKKNGYKLEKIKELLGSFRAVMFNPDDLTLVKESPEERRAFLNVAISQCYDSYMTYYYNYKKALENRNCLLKLSSKGMYIDENELISWSHYMAEYASHIYVMRRDYIKKLSYYGERIMSEISSGRELLEISYKSDIKEEKEERLEVFEEYKRIFCEQLERERAAGTSLFGPHRDDLIININKKSAKLFASQGQQRSVVLSLKLAEGEVCLDICGEYPVFLFDDVLSELDEDRRRYIFDKLGEKQIIITSCENTDGYDIPIRKIEVKNGVYGEIR